MPNSPHGSQGLPLADQPGTRWDYSHSTDVLGRIIEVISGQSLFQFEKERLLDPLGMSETVFLSPTRPSGHASPSRLPQDRLSVRPPSSRSDAAATGESGGAGLVWTIGDYARFPQMLLNGGALEGRRYLKPETVALMASDHIGPGTNIGRDTLLFSGCRPAALVWALPCARQCRRIPNGRLANIAGTASGGTFFFVDPGMTCSVSSWCKRHRSAGGSNLS